MNKLDVIQQEDCDSLHIQSILERIVSATQNVMIKFRDISEQIQPTFETLDTWKSTNHSKLDESQKLHDDFADLEKCLNTLKGTIRSFLAAPKPIQNTTGANTLIARTAEYTNSINVYVKDDGFEVDNENDAKVFSQTQNKYFEFIALMKLFFTRAKQEGFVIPEVKNIHGDTLD